MPRVNRDLQRRMAARRERERRRPSAERRYQFTTAEPEVDETLLEEDGENGTVAKATTARAAAPAAAARGTIRPTPKPFSAYKDEYAYVYGDLRRVAAVIGGLLVVLVVLFFVLPLLVH